METEKLSKSVESPAAKPSFLERAAGPVIVVLVASLLLNGILCSQARQESEQHRLFAEDAAACEESRDRLRLDYDRLWDDVREWTSAAIPVSIDGKEAYGVLRACLDDPAGLLLSPDRISRDRHPADSPPGLVTHAPEPAVNAFGTRFAFGDRCEMAPGMVLRLSSPHEGFHVLSVDGEDDGRPRTCPVGAYHLVTRENLTFNLAIREACRARAVAVMIGRPSPSR